ncbi:putative iron transport system substrate-binding protein [Gloeothece citriformis PCC 7424]|uniref:Putative iron transport system substrate-binding protein n=1 Tax=Gloeothece citriformis (strain PCC 7424) TaxID=65393 RepID=B7KFA4_GLOC7|nr:cobalamin-binding protein [Gloeothece citriformis]ACK71820.1 putative iron transport system substrate-binding protein [Gloeothece citriformis PCC 7424]
MTNLNSLRIVSLLPSATEIIACLGLREALVGRSHECDYPPTVEQLPICTEAKLNSNQPSLKIDADVRSLVESALSIYQLKTEVIESLQPSHIITQDQCDVCAVSFSEVKKAVAQEISTQPEIISLQPHRLGDIWADLERVATTLNIPSAPVINSLQERIGAIAEKTQGMSETQRPTIVALEWVEPLMGAGTWIPELIELAGGNARLSKVGSPSPYLKWEDLADIDPDMIIIMPCGFDLERTRCESQVLTQNPSWNNLQAVKNNQVFITDGNAYFNRPGPRLVDSLEILAEIFHPSLFNFGYQNQSWQKLS